MADLDSQPFQDPSGPQEGRLLELPPELMNNIYELALLDLVQVPQASLEMQKSFRVGKTEPSATPSAMPDLVLACKQIYVEENGAQKVNSSPRVPLTSEKFIVAPKSGSRLYALPVELWNHVYQLSCNINQAVFTSRVKAPALLIACKRTYAETLQLYYCTTVFEARNHEQLKRWLQDLGSPRICLEGTLPSSTTTFFGWLHSESSS
ncbi:hypothetical protein DOTSEDRAFT_28435 [Dothistroma septosporum NZE10]|uniref:Uncharacterized protein n=1 Tax=Dothistroma septosporum (strain NZE10 / CBS 128990) TaxID=675120 RepID=M2XIH6_DOTSN|nr:hypothetical protein DOTSEDRAFT_28435 [Dothistroma septosporum NZE10]